MYGSHAMESVPQYAVRVTRLYPDRQHLLSDHRDIEDDENDLAVAPVLQAGAAGHATKTSACLK